MDPHERRIYALLHFVYYRQFTERALTPTFSPGPRRLAMPSEPRKSSEVLSFLVTARKPARGTQASDLV